MAVSGLPEYEEGHAKHICLLALDMMDLSQTVTVDEEPVVSVLISPIPIYYWLLTVNLGIQKERHLVGKT